MRIIRLHEIVQEPAWEGQVCSSGQVTILWPLVNLWLRTTTRHVSRYTYKKKTSLCNRKHFHIQLERMRIAYVLLSALLSVANISIIVSFPLLCPNRRGAKSVKMRPQIRLRFQSPVFPLRLIWSKFFLYMFDFHLCTRYIREREETAVTSFTSGEWAKPRPFSKGLD